LLFVRGATCVKSTRVEWMLIRSPLLFVRDDMHVKSIRVEWDVNQEPLTFCMRWFANRACDQE
jgi:hypothetical protein